MMGEGGIPALDPEREEEIRQIVRVSKCKPDVFE